MQFASTTGLTVPLQGQYSVRTTYITKLYMVQVRCGPMCIWLFVLVKTYMYAIPAKLVLCRLEKLQSIFQPGLQGAQYSVSDWSSTEDTWPSCQTQVTPSDQSRSLRGVSWRWRSVNQEQYKRFKSDYKLEWLIMLTLNTNCHFMMLPRALLLPGQRCQLEKLNSWR